MYIFKGKREIVRKGKTEKEIETVIMKGIETLLDPIQEMRVAVVEAASGQNGKCENIVRGAYRQALNAPW